MKRVLMTMATAITLFSCQNEIQQSVSPTENEISVAQLEKLEAMGFNTIFPIQQVSGGVLVEGDIFIANEDITGEALFGNSPQTEQYRSTYILTCAKAKKIKVKNSLNKKSTAGKAVQSAINKWNNVNGSNLKFQLVSKGQDITIKADKGSLSSCVVATAGFPGSSGTPFATVTVNTDFKSFCSGTAFTKAQFASNIAHELGHCVGLRHTNWSSLGEGTATQIPGSGTTDANSIMNGSSAEDLKNLTANDKKAIKKLYNNGKDKLCK